MRYDWRVNKCQEQDAGYNSQKHNVVLLYGIHLSLFHVIKKPKKKKKEACCSFAHTWQ